MVVIGEARVGKTSLSYKFWAGEFDPEQQSSINASHLVKVLKVSDGKPNVKLNIWVGLSDSGHSGIGEVPFFEPHVLSGCQW